MDSILLLTYLLDSFLEVFVKIKVSLELILFMRSELLRGVKACPSPSEAELPLVEPFIGLSVVLITRRVEDQVLVCHYSKQFVSWVCLF